MTKRILAILLALTLSLTMFALPTMAADGFTLGQDENVITGTWDAVDGASSYKLEVYKDGKVVSTTTKNGTTGTYTISASGKYQFVVTASGTEGIKTQTSAIKDATYTQTSTANGIKFTRTGTTVTASWDAPKTTTGTPVYTVTYKVGSNNSVTQKNVNATSFTVTAKETEAVYVSVSYEELNGNILVKSDSIGSATLSASGSATGSTTTTPSTTGALTYYNGYLSWTSKGDGYTYQVSYVYNGKTYTTTTKDVYYQVPNGITSATVTYGIVATSYYKMGDIGTYSVSSSAASGVTYSNGYLSWASKGTGYIYYITYNTSNGNTYTYVESNSWQVPTGCTNATVYYGVSASGSFQSYGTVGYWSSNGNTATGSVYLISGTRVVYWNTVSNVSIYYIYSGNTQIDIVQAPTYTVPAGYSNVTVKYYSNGSLVTLGTAYLSSTSGSTNTSTATITTEGTNCKVVSTASSATVTWTSTGSSPFTVCYVVDGVLKKVTSKTNTATIPVGHSTSFTIMVLDSKENYIAGAYVPKSSSSSTTTDTTGAKSETHGLTLTPSKSGTTITWDKVSSASGYYILYSLYGSAGGFEGFAVTNSFVIPYGSGKDYQVYVYSVNSANKKTLIGYAIHIASDTSSSSGNTTTTGSEYVTGFKGTQNGSNKIKLSWTAAEGATSYTVYWKRSSNTTWKKATTTSNTVVTLKGLNNGTSYDFKIVANSKDSSILTMSPSATGNKTVTVADPKTNTTTVTVPKLSAVTSTASGTVSVKWTAVSGATSYKVYFAEAGSNSYKAKATVSENGCNVTGLTSGATYKVRVKALVNGEWTKLSDCEYLTIAVK